MQSARRSIGSWGVTALLALLVTLGACGGPPAPTGPGAAPRVELDDPDPRVRAAVDTLLERIDADPGDAAARGELGMTYDAHGVRGAALDCYAQASALDPSNADWPYLAALLRARRGDLEAALDDLDRSLAIDGAYVPAHLHRGTWLLDLDRADDAAAAFAQASALDAGSVAAALGSARAALARGDAETAIALLEPLASRTSEPYAKQLLATAHRQRGDLARATEILAGARRAAPPRWPDPRTDRVSRLKTGYGAEMATAEQLLAAGRHAEAAELLERLRLERPGDEALLNNLSVAYRRQNLNDLAFEVLRGGLERHPDYFAFHLNISSDYVRMGRTDQALFHLTRASELNPMIARPHVVKGQLLTRNGDLAGALESFEAALRSEPREPTSLFYSGILSLQLGLTEQSIDRLRRAIDVQPDHARAMIGLVTAYVRNGDLELAQETLDRAAALAPGSAQLANARRELDRARGGS